MALVGEMQYLTIGDSTYSLPSSGGSGTVTSVRVQATSPVQSSQSTEQTTTLNTTISLANGYGDTKNPYDTKSANYVLAGPTSGTSVAPSFRKLVKADIPDLSDTYLTSYTETDPVFSASAAADITSSDITNWNNKVSDDKTWNSVSLTKSSSSGAAAGYVPYVSSTDATSASYYPVASGGSVGANQIPKYTSAGYLVSNTPTAGDSSTKVATTEFVQDAMSGAGAGTVTSVGLSNATNGGLSVSGSPITSNGTITVGHSNVLTNAQTTQAVYPIKIDKNGHVSDYGSAVTIPTKVSDLTNDSGFITSYIDENMKWTASTSSNTYYPLQSTSTATTSTANTLNSVSFYQYYNTAGGYRRLDLGNSTAYKTTGGAYGTIRLYGAAATYYGDLIPGTLGTTSGDGHLTANRTWTFPNASGTIALTSDIPTVPTNISAFTNDAGYLTSYTETDPTVPSWAKASTKPSYTASEVGAAATSHAHGNITSDGDITATAPTIANGDQIIINDSSASKITNGPTFDGSTTTKYLSQKGTWESLPQSTAYSAGTGLSLSSTTFNHSNSVTAQTTQAVYPIKIDAQGHISDYGTAVTIPTKTSDLTNDSGFITSYTDEKLAISAITSGTTYYPIVATNSTGAAARQYDNDGFEYYGVNGVSGEFNTGQSRLTLGNNKAYATSKWKRGILRLYGTTTYYVDLKSSDGGPTANRTLTLPNADGTLALTSNIPTSDFGLLELDTSAQSGVDYNLTTELTSLGWISSVID